ncbi:MAG: hypothetical protein NTY96_02025 [Bacteroidetes bacterium]|nr:hypothetical protein [Bacteroidota bacterium]
MRSETFICVLMFSLILLSCHKDKVPSEISIDITMQPTTIDSLPYNGAFVTTHLSFTNGTVIDQHGHCWSTQNNPTVKDPHSSLGQQVQTGTFSSNIGSLLTGTRYFVRPYVIYQAAVIYGPEVEFISMKTGLPLVLAADVTRISMYSAVAGGKVTADSGLKITARGVCWNTSGNPRLEDCISHTSDSSGMGTFKSSIKGLTIGTTYYITAYATNEKGTSYSTEIKQFTTKNCGMALSYGGGDYPTVLIGLQCWMAKNLNVGKKIFSSDRSGNNGIIEKYCFDNLESNCTVYGGLYDWDEMMQYKNTEGTKGICPEGWHIPADSELTTLITYLGGDLVAGGKLKETGTVHWADPNIGATNSSGFTAIPGGNKGEDSGFGILTSNGYLWSSSQYNETSAWRIGIYHQHVYVDRFTNTKLYGFSVRCIQDVYSP